MFTQSKSNKKKQLRYEAPVERMSDFPRVFTGAIKSELNQAKKDTWKQIWGLEQAVAQLSGELKAGESLDLTQGNSAQSQESEYPELKEMVQPGFEYHRPFARVTETRTIIKEDTRQIQMRIGQIVMELKKLTSSSQELEIAFKEVSMTESPVEPGTYHLNFFEWVFSVIQKARERIDESQAWLSTFKSKKKQKGYWNMFKKHGTTFGLSSERVVATQTG